MKTEAQEPAALEKRAQPGRLRSIFLAVAVHLAFFALIIFGVSWQSSPTPPMQAELWDKLPPAPSRSAPSRPEPPLPKPDPPRPDPPKPEPPKKPADVKPDPPKADPAIALRREREKREKDKRERADQQKQDEAKRKREQEDSAKKKREQEDAEKKKREDDKRRVEEERVRKDAERAREEATSARQKLIDGFVDKIKARIRGRANVPDTVSGKPSVQVRIRILPGGEVLDIAVTRSSGNRVYDTAIERAIRSASPLPVPEASSELFPQFRDLILNIEHER
ncbi:MAG: cell envelope integrity protein TolA [Pseudomonadota bacterium]|nr:cell envelope integrity protein TolA [Pseudomonadota bacterium]